MLTQMVGAEGAEIRFPLLDRRVADYYLARSVRDRVSPLISKPLLRAAMRGLLPEAVRMRAGATEFTSFYTPLWRSICSAGNVHALSSIGLVSPELLDHSDELPEARTLRRASMTFAASVAVERLSTHATLALERTSRYPSDV
jgi:hypothetical protein